MGGHEERSRAATRPDDVIRAILLDHAEIRDLFAETAAATGRAKSAAFERLVTKLAIHETAEEEVVHPLARSAPGGADVVGQRLKEESDAKGVLAELEKIGVDDPGFEARLREVQRDVDAHAESEEKEEHPRLEQAVSEERLCWLAKAFRAAERTAPTHPYPRGPQSATGNFVVGPLAAIIDRTRDAVRKALKATG